jgi:hypothetical protein
MQGVSGSNPIGSIGKTTVIDKVFGGHMVAFFAPFCSSCLTWVVPCLPISVHNSAHREKMEQDWNYFDHVSLLVSGSYIFNVLAFSDQ